MNRPLAAIQLPAARTMTRTHKVHTVATCPARSDTTTNSAAATPAATRLLACAFANSAPPDTAVE